MDRKGLITLGQFAGVIMLLVVIGITLVVGVRIDTGIRDATPAAQTEALDAAKNATEGLANISENQGLLGTIIVFAVVLGVVVGAFAFGRRGA